MPEQTYIVEDRSVGFRDNAMTETDKRITSFESKFEVMQAKSDGKFEAMLERIDGSNNTLSAKMDGVADQTKYTQWIIGAFFALGALMIAIAQLIR